MSPKQIVDPREWNIPMGLVVVLIAAAVAVTGLVGSIKSDVAALRNDMASIKQSMTLDYVLVSKFRQWIYQTEKQNATWTAGDYAE
jgi:hypothetical protein